MAPIGVPPGQTIARVEAIALECVEDGARAPASLNVRVGYRCFERGRSVAWLELPDGSGLPVEHSHHAHQLRVRLELEPSGARPSARERVVTDWEDHGDPRRGTAKPGALELTGGAPGARADASPAGSSPRADLPAPFSPKKLSSLLGSPVAYLIITSAALVPAFQPLADWKTASGVPAAVRTLAFIRAKYPAAVDDPERVRMFIRDAYSRWGTRRVLLGGDSEILPPRIAQV